jgi:3-oxo-4,17-pregnadiene-20-carboxyl-CoA hydratase beta subunit
MKDRTLASVSVGDELPTLAIPLTTSLVVAGALASRDFTPVHHDRSAAQAVGMPDVFMNILTTHGLLGRYVTDWAGPNARVRGVKIRLGTPNHPGDTMTFSGRVAAKQGDEVKVDVVGRNRWGSHVTASVRVALPG